MPAATAAVHGCEAALLNTSKPVGAEATSGWEVRVCAELGACIVGGLDELRDAPGRRLRHLPGEPAQAAPRRHRGDRRVRPSGAVRHHPLDGDGRAARRRSPWPARWSCTTPRCSRASRWRSSPSAACRSSTARRRRRWTCASRRPRGLAGDGPDRRRRRPDVEAVPAAELHRRCVGRLQARRRPDGSREDFHRSHGGAGRGQLHLRCGNDRIGRHLRSGAARHGRRVDRA